MECPLSYFEIQKCLGFQTILIKLILLVKNFKKKFILKTFSNLNYSKMFVITLNLCSSKATVIPSLILDPLPSTIGNTRQIYLAETQLSPNKSHLHQINSCRRLTPDSASKLSSPLRVEIT